jgi:hypothetical protein
MGGKPMSRKTGSPTFFGKSTQGIVEYYTPLIVSVKFISGGAASGP